MNNHIPTLQTFRSVKSFYSINEGGAYGHLSHPFDDLELTFGDLKEMIKIALHTGFKEEHFAAEKTDGINMLFTWHDGKVKAARNGSHLKNFGESALDIQALDNMFAGRGAIQDVFRSALGDLEDALRKLSDKSREEIFQNGHRFMSMEIMHPATTVTVPYGFAMLRFHGIREVDSEGKQVGPEDKKAAVTLGKIIADVNASVGKEFHIDGPNIVSIMKDNQSDLVKKAGKYIAELTTLQKKYNLKDGDKVSTYHFHYWGDFIKKAGGKMGYEVPSNIVSALVNRWIHKDKSFTSAMMKAIPHPGFAQWATTYEKGQFPNDYKDVVAPFENIFLAVGTDLLTTMTTFLAVNPSEAAITLRNQLRAKIKEIENADNPEAIQKLRLEMRRLEATGGIDKIMPSEGITFVFKGKVYKLVGGFAGFHQIISIGKFNKKTVNESAVNESGGMIDTRPVQQKEIPKTVEFVERHILTKIGLRGIGVDAALIGSAGKKSSPEETSGDIDVAVSVDVLAMENKVPFPGVLRWLDTKLQSMGYKTMVSYGFNQVTIAFPVEGNPSNGFAQVDFMLSDSLEWSKFIYHSPDFRKAESKYKGVYRTMLLMSIVGKMNYKALKMQGDDVEEYESYVVRLNQGIVKIRKSFLGKNGTLIKTVKLLKEHDKFITNVPSDVIGMIFGEGFTIKDANSFESLVTALKNPKSNAYKFKDEILKSFRESLEQGKLPIPSEIAV